MGLGELGGGGPTAPRGLVEIIDDGTSIEFLFGNGGGNGLFALRLLCPLFTLALDGNAGTRGKALSLNELIYFYFNLYNVDDTLDFELHNHSFLLNKHVSRDNPILIVSVVNRINKYINSIL